MTATRTRNFSGYALLDRTAVLTALAAVGVRPVYDRVVAEHITYRYPDRSPAPAPVLVEVVGHVVGTGVQAVLIAVNGTTRRPDGKLFHLTLSLDAGRRPADSNELLASADITPLTPIRVPVRQF